MQNGNRVGNGLFKRFFSVFVNVGFVLLAVSETTRSADTAVYTRHTFDKLCVENISVLLQNSDFSLLYAVANARFEFEVVNTLFLYRFCYSVRQTAASREYSSEIGSVV